MRNEAMNDSPSAHGLGAAFNYPLPGSEHAWEKCTLGPVKGWSESLRAHILTISHVPYPAAVLWGDDYVLLHNQAWHDVTGANEQGLPQRDSLSPFIVDILHKITVTRLPQEVQSRDLVQEKVLALGQASTAILSPLVLPGQSRAEAILVQLLPKSILHQSLQLAGGGGTRQHDGNDGDFAKVADSK